MLNRRLRTRWGGPKPNPFPGFGMAESIRAESMLKASRLSTSPIFLFISLTTALTAPLLPTNPGTTWRYSMTEEVGKGLTISNLKQDADRKVRLPVLYHLDGMENVDGKELFKFEMHRAGAVTNTDLVTVDEHGTNGWQRIRHARELKRLKPR